MASKVITFLEDNGIPYVASTESDVRISCFNKEDHKNGDLNPSLEVNIEKGYFKCWSCNISGNFAQLIGGTGHINEVSSYVKNFDKSRLRYDISTLKSQGSEVINIPGFGKFYKEKKDEDYKTDFIINSRKVNVTEEIKTLSDRVLDGTGTLEDRRKLTSLMEGDRLPVFKIPDNFYQVKYLEYLSERGLPSNFCENYEVYLNKNNPKYFAFPVKNFNGDTINLLNISFSRETNPRMYSEIKGYSNPILGFNDIDYERDIYIVEGWLDYYKLKVLGYNCFPTLGNHFNYVHNSILQLCKGKKFFIFDNDIPGVSMLEDVITFISRSDTDWYGIFTDPVKYKDVGDIELLKIHNELKNSVVEPLLSFKKYKLLLGMEKYNASRKIIHADGYTLRSDPFFTDIRKSSRERDEGHPEQSSFKGTGLPERVKSETKLSYPW